ncbi:MAG: M56 family metallopeptidase [Bacteroidales bacterium]|jgi:bla regulator protein BlaR1|nr:M56 family metallopeptidase [Bacteroidales bacterium]
MNILSDLLNDRIVTALGWNIFHIFWQGIIIGIVLSVVLHILKGKSSQLKYLISMISLLLLLGFSIFNFSINYNENFNKAITNINYDQINYTDFQLDDLNNANTGEGSIELITSLKNRLKNIDRFFPLIVNVWILGVFIFILKFVLSFFYTYRLKKISTQSISEEWLVKFLKIQDKLNLNRTVKYIESQLVRIPLVLGYLRPVVVIPVQMLSGIPSNQIEAIIAHELAHIRRNDYIFNVLQTIIETVFFFHPAVWYITSQIRKERENCCDDVALTVCEGSLVYAKALISVQELTLNRHYSAVAFSGRKKHLLNRIKRMIMKQKVKSNFTDKIIAALIILSSVLALSFTYKANMTNSISKSGFIEEIIKPVEPTIVEEIIEPIEPPIVEEYLIYEAVNLNDVQEIEAIVKDTVKTKRHHREEIDIDNNTVTKTIRDGNGKKSEMKFILKNGIVTKLLIDGKEVSQSDYPKFQPEIDKTVANLKAAKIDIHNAMKDIEDIDFEEIQKEVQEALSNVNLNFEEISEEIARSMEEVKEIDYEKIMKKVEINLDVLKDMDFEFDIDIDLDLEDFDIDVESIRADIERARDEMKVQVDMEAIQKEMIKVQEELSKMNTEELKIQIQEGMENFEKQNKEEIIKELEEKLEELENLELEEK